MLICEHLEQIKDGASKASESGSSKIFVKNLCVTICEHLEQVKDGASKASESGIKRKLLFFLSGLRSKIFVVDPLLRGETENRRTRKIFIRKLSVT